MRFFTSLFAFCLGTLALPHSLSGQTATDPQIAVDASQTRHIISPPNSHPVLRIYNLLPGKAYALVLPVAEQLNNCQPTAIVLGLGVESTPFDLVNHELKFTANSPMMDFQLDYPCDWD